MGMPKTCPEWAKNAVFYQIFPDRFARSARGFRSKQLEAWDSRPSPMGYKGGDLFGVAEKLDWLVDLGINAIYLNPIFASTANHRYHTYDYLAIDPILGGEDAFKALLDQAHRKNIRIILDGVFNHASRGFYPFNHTLENGINSVFKDWFYFDEDKLLQGKSLHAYPEESHHAPGYQAWWNLHALPKFNVREPAARRYLLDAVRKWTEMGIDGWRLDVPMEIEDRTFWDDFTQTVLSINSDAYLVGEIWDEAPDWVSARGPFDAVMNYPLTKALLGFCGGEHLDIAEIRKLMSFRDVGAMSARDFSRAVQRLFSVYGQQKLACQFNLLDSHDTPRFLTSVGGDERILAQAVFFLCVFPGIPCIYYGDEIGMSGGRDPDCRQGFIWDAGRQNRDLLKTFRDCIALRRTHPVLVNGDYQEIPCTDPALYAFSRSDGMEVFLAFLNVSNEKKAISLHRLPEGVPPALLRHFGSEEFVIEPHGYCFKTASAHSLGGARPA